MGCSIEISRDIFMCMCLSYVKLTALAELRGVSRIIKGGGGGGGI